MVASTASLTVSFDAPMIGLARLSYACTTSSTVERSSSDNFGRSRELLLDEISFLSDFLRTVAVNTISKSWSSS